MEYIQHGAFWVTGLPAENPYRFLMAHRKKNYGWPLTAQNRCVPVVARTSILKRIPVDFIIFFTFKSRQGIQNFSY